LRISTRSQSGLAGHAAAPCRIEGEVEIPGEDRRARFGVPGSACPVRRARFGADGFGEFSEVDRNRVGTARFQVAAGQLQHLFDEARGAHEAVLRLLQRLVAFGAVAGAQGHL
jgi:hypothetical protein